MISILLLIVDFIEIIIRKSNANWPLFFQSERVDVEAYRKMVEEELMNINTDLETAVSSYCPITWIQFLNANPYDLERPLRYCALKLIYVRRYLLVVCSHQNVLEVQKRCSQP